MVAMNRLLPTSGAILLALVPALAVAADKPAAPQASDRTAKRQEARVEKLERAYSRHMQRCSSEDENACSDARDDLAQIQSLKLGAPQGGW